MKLLNFRIFKLKKLILNPHNKTHNQIIIKNLLMKNEFYDLSKSQITL